MNAKVTEIGPMRKHRRGLFLIQDLGYPTFCGIVFDYFEFPNGEDVKHFLVISAQEPDHAEYLQVMWDGCYVSVYHRDHLGARHATSGYLDDILHDAGIPTNERRYVWFESE